MGWGYFGVMGALLVGLVVAYFVIRNRQEED